MKKILGVFLLVGLLLAGSQVFADTIVGPLSDTQNYWPGWGNSNDNNTPSVFNPDIINGSAIIGTTGYLKQLTFNITNMSSLLKASDLFIDKDANGSWDYVVNLLVGNSTNTGFNYGDGFLYSITNPLALNSTAYTKSFLDYDGNGQNNYLDYPGYREKHPVAYDVSSNLTLKNSNNILSGFSSTTGWSSASTQTFNFGANDILLGSQFTIGWTQHCANDVFYETFNNPVPEPASMLLMGSGLIGLAGWGRKKFFKKETVVA